MSRQEWLRARQQGIGSSDAPIIHGVSEYKTPLQLYQEKIADTVDEKTSYILERGNQLEPEARKLFSAIYSMEHEEEAFEPLNVKMSELPFMMASLDGASKDRKTIIEIKYQGKEKHVSTAVDIRTDYWIQIQHQLLVSGADRCYFVSYNPDCDPSLIYKVIYRDKEFFKKHLEVCTKFWSCVLNRVPPDVSDDDFVVIKDTDLLSQKYLDIKKAICELEIQLDTVKAEILKNISHPKTMFGSLKVTKVEKAGAIQYKLIPAIKNMNKVELERYRAKPSVYWDFKNK